MLGFVLGQGIRDQRQEQTLKDLHSRAEKGDWAVRTTLRGRLPRLEDWDNDGRLPNGREVGITYRQIKLLCEVWNGARANVFLVDGKKIVRADGRKVF
jgi:hypothetical protein